MFLFGLIATGAGEAIVVYVLGIPLTRALRHTHLFATDR
jgi:hypothetical protein